MFLLYWLCLDLDNSDKDFVSKSLQELARVLRRPPIEVELKVSPLASKAERVISDVLRRACSEVSHYVLAIDRAVNNVAPWRPLLVYSQSDSHLARAGQRQNRLAVWGGNCGSLSAVYRCNHKPILWHETLHLLGAKECYDESNPSAPPICELGSGCIMQWEPHDSTISAWPFICKKNVVLIRELVARSRARRNQ